MLVQSLLSALVNVVFLVALPLLAYYAYHKRRHGRGARDILQRLGLCLGEREYIGHCVVFASAIVLMLVLKPPRLEPFTRAGSPQQSFVGLGLTPTTIFLSLLYGVFKTGFTEEFFFRGLIAGSLARRLSPNVANLLQSLIFLLPHFLVLLIMPGMWPFLIFVFVGSIFLGWVRIQSGSILGPWLVHAAVNVTMCLSVAIRSTS